MPHIHEKIDFDTDALIVYQGRVLFVHHKKYGRWLLPGGHTELDEDPEQALFREIEEEIGLTRSDLELLDTTLLPFDPINEVKPLPRPRFMDIHQVSDQHRHIRLAFVLRAKTDNVRAEPEESYDIRWFKLDELHDPLLRVPATLIHYAEEAIRVAA